jgi:hypothetical protein
MAGGPKKFFAKQLGYFLTRRMIRLVSASCFSPTKPSGIAAQQGSTAKHQPALLGEIFMTINRFSGEKFGQFCSKQYELACAFLDCEAFKSWHTPSRDEWSEVLASIKKMVKQYDWPLYEVARDGDDASSTCTMNTGLLLNAIHKLLGVFEGYDVRSVPSPGQWGDIMRVVDETTERRAVVDQAAKPQR